MTTYCEFRNTEMNFDCINYNSISIHLKNLDICLYLEQEKRWFSESRMCLMVSDLAKTLCASPELIDY